MGDQGGDSGVRPTILKAGERWSKNFQKSLLSNKMDSSTPELKTERDAAFDLLDALSRSGALTIDGAALHVVVAATHCFDKSLMATVIEDNVNPIQGVERTSLVMTSAIHGVSPARLVGPASREHVQALMQ